MHRESHDGEPIASPFDGRVVFRAKRDDEGCEAPPEELACLGERAVDSRRREFLRGRAAARLALQALAIGHAPPVGKGAHGEPLWPAGVVGSISHTRELAVAAVGWRAQVAGIGLDVEPRDRRVAAGVAARVCLPEELRWVESTDLTGGPRRIDSAGGKRPGSSPRDAPADPLLRFKMVFAAKEAVYKALYPVEQVFLGFKDVELRWDAPACHFRGELRRAAGADYPAGFVLEVGCSALEREVLASLCLPPVARVA